MTIKNVAVAYYSQYGHTKLLAEKVAAGAAISGVEVEKITEEEWNELDKADAIIFGAPTYMGSAPWQFKQFMDISSKRWAVGKWKDKIAAGFTVSSCMNGDKANTIAQLSVFAAQHGMIWVPLGIAPGNNHSKGSLSDLNRLGGTIGAMVQANGDQGADAIIESELKTVEALGKRVSEITLRFH